MEVSAVEAIPLAYPLDDGRAYGSARGTVDQRVSTLIRVESRDGTVGWGEAFGPPRTTATLVEELFSDIVVGMNPFEVESLCEQNYAGLYHFGSSGIIQSASSGIDIALWDLIGTSLGSSVGELLGGRKRSTVTPYASTMYITEWDQDPEVPIRAAVDEGFTAAKIKIGRGINDDIERVRTALELLDGDARLMVDCNGNYRADQAIKLARALEPYDVHWIEEPLPPEDLLGYERLRERVDVSIAAGEAAYARFEFQELFDRGIVDIAQPDVCKCGGLSEARLIAKMATTHNISISPHNWTGAIGLAASLQYVASLPRYPHSTNVPEELLFEFDRADNVLREELLESPIDPTGGTVAIPDGPGLGVEVDREIVDEYRIDSS